MAAFALRRRQPGRSLVACLHHGRRLMVGRKPVEIAFHDMRHDEIRVFGKRGVDGGDRIADEALQFVQRLFIVHRAGGVGAGERQVERIPHRHG